MRLEEKIAKQLIKHNKTIAIAESCTGGLLTHRLTNIPGSSCFLQAALILYSNEAKMKILGIPARLLKQHGAVSKQTATAMAKSARQLFNTDFGIAITGIAGPGGSTHTKPVGLTYIAITTRQKTQCLQYLFQKNRVQNKTLATNQALKILLKLLSYNDSTTL